MTKTPVKLHIRWMIERDRPFVLEIDYRSFRPHWDTKKLAQRLAVRNCIGLVVECTEEETSTVGFMVYTSEKQHLELHRLAVHPEWRRQGVGQAMVQKLISKLDSHKRHRLEVRVPDMLLPSQLFFRHCGLLAKRVVYDEETERDAYLMEWDINEQ